MTSWPIESVSFSLWGLALTLLMKVVKSPCLAALMVGVSEASHWRHSLILSLAARRREAGSRGLKRSSTISDSHLSQHSARTNTPSRWSLVGHWTICLNVDLTSFQASRLWSWRSCWRHSHTDNGRGDKISVCNERNTAWARLWLATSPNKIDNSFETLRPSTWHCW